ncbi:putative fucosyl transferase [Marinobacter nitratireducens]|uniref:Putative fucosyl transferase n=1 Tax=Marinobacter nitratireducens TaxID=1137280 RepID=A0A072NGJ6_9GAMM|nr:glycosyltransferase family A protein [Marinobacter nitratireducens]KEF32235.1 putative fucosyl transferase [Marinobacter nitratireducens]
MTKSKCTERQMPLGSAVSIIIPLFNKEDTIRKTLTQVLKVGPYPNEIIVVDDGSTDQSYKIAQEFSENISLYRQTNKGPSSARNLGAKHARNKHLVFLDADDELVEGVCEEHLRLRELFPKSRLTYVSFEIYDVLKDVSEEQILTSRLDSYESQEPREFSRFNFKLIENIAAGSFCIDKDIFLKSGGFDENLKIWEITDSLIRFRLHTKSQAISPKVLCRKNNDSRNSQFCRFQKNIDQHIYYSRKLLSYADLLPNSEIRRVSLEVIYCLNKLWIERNILKMSELYSDAYKTLGPNALRGLSLKIRVTSAIMLNIKKFARNQS